MEKRCFGQFETYLMKYKNDIQKKILDLSFENKEKINELLEYIFEYEKPTLHIEKKKQKNTKLVDSKNNVHTNNYTNTIMTPNNNNDNNNTQNQIQGDVNEDNSRCNALRKQGDRCTRKKTKGSCYCGTHYLKSDENKNKTECSTTINNEETHKKEVIAQEIQGIIYYMDEDLNVYNTEDIFKNVNNPKIIAKAVQLGTNSYSIPSLGL
jgi:hypothetical protein